MIFSAAWFAGLARSRGRWSGASVTKVRSSSSTSLHGATQRRRDLSQVARELTRYCRRVLGWSVRIGIGSTGGSPEQLSRCYQQAFEALNLSFQSGEAMVFFDDHAKDAAERMRTSFDAYTGDWKNLSRRATRARFRRAFRRFYTPSPGGRRSTWRWLTRCSSASWGAWCV